MGKKINRAKGPDAAIKLPLSVYFVYCVLSNNCINLENFIVTPHTRCRLKLLKLERVKDYLMMEEEFILNQEILKPQEEINEVKSFF